MRVMAGRVVLQMLLGLTIAQSVGGGPSFAQDPAGVIAAGAEVNGIVDNLRNSLRDVLSRLDQSVSSGTFLARMQITNLLAELDYRASGLVGKTFGQLDKEQQVFFQNTQRTIVDLQAMGDKIAANADSVAQRAEFAIGSVPFTKTEPRLRSAAPRVIARSTAAKPVRVVLDGSWLANGNPELLLGGGACTLAQLAEPKAAFDCEAKLFAGDDAPGVRYVSGTFSAVKSEGWWDSIRRFFGGKPERKPYPVSIGIVRDNFAHAKVAVTALEDGEETNRRSAKYDTGAQHCTWGSETTINVSPAGPEWSIDVNSISLVLDSGEHSELRNVTSRGFQVYAVGHNSGNCAKVLGQTVSYDARGWANGHVDWTERKKTSVPRTAEVFDGDLPWGDTRVIPLPAGLQTYIVTLSLFNGATRQYNAPVKDELFAIERDEAGRSLKLAPRQIGEAFK